jgi:hypothetical protein
LFLFTLKKVIITVFAIGLFMHAEAEEGAQVPTTRLKGAPFPVMIVVLDKVVCCRVKQRRL